MSSELAASYAFCEGVARRQARNFYPSFLLLPTERRRSMCALYAFMRQTDDIADEPGEPAEKRTAIAHWRTALHERAGSWPGWPALAETVDRHGIPVRYLDDVIDGVAMDVEPLRFATFDDLHGYCYRVASAVGLCCLHIWGFRSEGGRAEALAEDCGVALQLTNIIRDVREDARNARIYLPEDELARFGVSLDDLTVFQPSASVRELLVFQAARARDYYEKAAPLAGLVDPVGRPVLLGIVGVYAALLREIERRDYDVLSARVSVPRWRKAAIMVKAFASRFAAVGIDAEAPPLR